MSQLHTVVSGLSHSVADSSSFVNQSPAMRDQIPSRPSLDRQSSAKVVPQARVRIKQTSLLGFHATHPPKRPARNISRPEGLLIEYVT